MSINRRICVVKQLLRNIRHLHSSHITQAYEGSGKTTVTFLNQVSDRRLCISQCLPIGFKLSDGGLIIGPLIIFPRTILSWNIKSVMDINESTLSLFTALEPKLDLLILGLDKQYEYSRILEIKEILVKRNIPVEILPVEQASAVFNFVSDEGRYAAAGLVPPKLEESSYRKRLAANLENVQKEKALALQ